MLTSPSNKSYIGQSKNLEKRISSYKHLHCEKQWAIYNAIKKYGWENFEVKYLFTDNVENLYDGQLNELEQKYIIEYNTVRPFGYNLTNGGDGKYVFTDETKNKISENNKGKHLSQESIKHISSTLKEGYKNGRLKKQGCKPIIVLKNNEYIMSFDSIMDAKRFFNYKTETTIINILKGRTKQTREGYIFKYKK